MTLNYWMIEERYPKGHFTHEKVARDYHTSSTLIGGKDGAGPSSLHTTLEGPTEYNISECKIDVKSTWILTWHQMK